MMWRRALLGFVLLLASAAANGETGNAFAAFLAALWPDAATKGITRATFDAAFAGLTPDPAVLAAMRREPEYGKPFGAYVASLASPSRIAHGLAQIGAMGRDAARRRRQIRRRSESFWSASGASNPPSATASSAGTFSARSRRWRRPAFSSRCFATNF